MKYTINEIPPSNNKFIGRTNKWEYQEKKKYWAKLIFLKCRPKPEKPLEKAVVTLTYFFGNKIRRDGLVKAGIIADDSFSNIDLRLCGKVDKKNPRTEIEITNDSYSAVNESQGG